MAKRNKKPKRLVSLSQGRPPTFQIRRSLSSKATRKIIRSHHNLQKQRANALAHGDDDKAAALLEQIENQGGIEGYQMASLIGQSKERGGDSSRLLLEWLKPVVTELKQKVADKRPLRMLEIGALSQANACTTCKLFDVERIDLNNQTKYIKSKIL